MQIMQDESRGTANDILLYEENLHVVSEGGHK